MRLVQPVIVDMTHDDAWAWFLAVVYIDMSYKARGRGAAYEARRKADLEAIARITPRVSWAIREICHSERATWHLMLLLERERLLGAS